MPITTPKVPDGLPELMKGLAKSVIKENPDNIYVHAAEYFENLIRERDGDLDKGYGSFSAYKVYSDYKDKCREKGGSASSGSGGPAKVAVSDGDDDESGGSALAAARGRRRKRVRKQGSKDSNKSVEKDDVPSSAGSGNGENLSSIKEDAPLTEKTIEEEVVKAETRKEVQSMLSKTISIDSQAAANAVSTVLEDTVLDSDEANRETGEVEETEEAEWANLKQPINCEDLSSYPAEDYGSAPSTAEVVGEVAEDGEVLVEDAPEAEVEQKKNADEVDLSVSEKANVEEPVVNGSHEEVTSESPKKLSEEQVEPEEGIDTVDADKNQEIVVESRMGTENENAIPDMPEVPTDDPGTNKDLEQNDQEVIETKSESPKTGSSEKGEEESPEGCAEETEGNPISEEHQSDTQENAVEQSEENNEPEKHSSGSASPQKASSNAASDEKLSEDHQSATPEMEQTSKQDDTQATSSPQKPASAEATDESLAEVQQSVPSEEEQISNQEDAPPSEGSSPKKSGSVEDNQKSNESEAPPAESKSPEKSASVDATDENQKSNDASQSEGGSPKKSASVEETNEPEEGQGSLPTDEVEKSDKEEAPTKSASVDEGTASPTKPASIDATNEPVVEDEETAPAAEEQVSPVATETGSPAKPASIDEANESEKQQESAPQEDNAASNSLEKPASESDDQGTAPPEEESKQEDAPASGSSSPAKSASVEGQPEKQDSQIDSKSASVEEPQPENNSKESSIEKTESEPNADDEQSKESSAKESEGDASKQDASEEAEQRSDDASPEPSAPPSEAVETENNSEEKVGSGNDSKEEAIEEPCIQRQVSPSTSKPISKNQSTDQEEIKKVDLAAFNKDSAEALFYSLKKTELESAEGVKKEGEDEDDDADVVLGEEAPASISRQLSKRSFTDDFLEKGPITEEAPKQAEGDGVSISGEDGEFNPMMVATVRNQQLQEQLHSRDDASLVEAMQRKTPIRRSMTERVELARQDSNYVDLRKYDPDYVQEEDEFDGYYIGNIKNKILASSVSVADSDDFDPRQSQEVIDDNNVRTALETIVSTDTESTLPSQTTVQANRGFLQKGSNIPYASFGNNAIDQSLDDFIEREEQNKEAEEQAAASKIQRSYRQFRSNKKKLLRDYQSTMQTFTEDQSTESLEEYPNQIIQIKVDQKQPTSMKGEESEGNSLEDARAENLRRPMYSLNIDEYDTAARRMTLTRGAAMQRTSTPEEDSGKADKKESSSEPVTKVAEGSTISTSEPSSTEDKKGASGSSSDEKENKDTGSSKSSESKAEAPKATRPLSDSRKQAGSLEAQKLFLARQRTMPVQIDASVIRVLPKHMRKRNKSAGMVRK